MRVFLILMCLAVTVILSTKIFVTQFYNSNRLHKELYILGCVQGNTEASIKAQEANCLDKWTAGDR